MSTDPSQSPRRRTRLVTALVSMAAVLLPATALATLPIEDYARYDPQSTCSPSAKAGTVKLAAWLQKEYPSTGSMGISRSCKSSGVSEHKEGRAFDWATSVYAADDRAAVNDFMRRAFATDAEGNKHALARRMGIMYLIWNDKIYSAYRGYEARAYTPCPKVSNCSDSARHRNHVHISLTRAAAAGRTSWYLEGTPPPPPPAPLIDLSKKPFEKLAVPATGATVRTPWRLRDGTSYKVTVSGLYGYGAPTQVADASCRWVQRTGTWTPQPGSTLTKSHGSLDLLIDGQRLSADRCWRSHTYSRVVRMTSNRQLAFRVATKPGVSTGELTVVVSRVDADVKAALPTYPTLVAPPRTSAPQAGTGLLGETVSVPATSPVVRTTGAVEEGVDYRLTVTGSAGLGTNLGRATTTDGRCVGVAGTWYSQASIDRRVPGAQHGRLYVDGVPFAGRAADGPLCATREHAATWTATRSGRLELALWDPITRDDNSGAVSVQVQRVTPMVTPSAAPAEQPTTAQAWRQATDTVRVSAAAPAGALTTMRVRAGQRVDLVARGTLRSGALEADASCVRTPAGWRATDARLALRQDPLALWVDGRQVTWRPVGAKTGCSPTHAYRATYTAAKHGRLRLTVLDLDHRDNRGALSVALTR